MDDGRGMTITSKTEGEKIWRSEFVRGRGVGSTWEEKDMSCSRTVTVF